MKRVYLLLSGLLIAVTVTAFAFTTPDGGKDKKKAKDEVRTECCSMQSQTACQGHGAMNGSCDKAKCQCTCDQANCKGNCTGTCDQANCNGNCKGTCDQANCSKQAEAQKK